MLGNDGFWFWVILLGATLINIGVYFFRAKDTSPTNRSLLKIGASLTQVSIFVVMILLTIPGTYHADYVPEKYAEQTAMIIKQQEQLTNIERNLGRIQTLLFGIFLAAGVGTMSVNMKLPSKKEAEDKEGPIVLGLNVK
jgi:Na+/proline symporter